jgi:alpha-tubulin suppressor-like RCC1 family protein
MFSRKSFLILVLSIFSINDSGMAITCGRLEKVSAGEDHSLALADNQTLWACGGKYNNYYQLGLGGDV